jgi:hypothetical protein
VGFVLGTILGRSEALDFGDALIYHLDRPILPLVGLFNVPNNPNELPFHLKEALEDGVTRDEIARDVLLQLANGHDGTSDSQARVRRSQR